MESFRHNCSGGREMMVHVGQFGRHGRPNGRLVHAKCFTRREATLPPRGARMTEMSSLIASLSSEDRALLVQALLADVREEAGVASEVPNTREAILDAVNANTAQADGYEVAETDKPDEVAYGDEGFSFDAFGIRYSILTARNRRNPSVKGYDVVVEDVAGQHTAGTAEFMPDFALKSIFDASTAVAPATSTATTRKATAKGSKAQASNGRTSQPPASVACLAITAFSWTNGVRQFSSYVADDKSDKVFVLVHLVDSGDWDNLVSKGTTSDWRQFARPHSKANRHRSKLTAERALARYESQVGEGTKKLDPVAVKVWA